jgi:hypothetical protein
MRDLLASRESAAHLAMDYFAYRATKEIGVLAAVLGGIDGLVFTRICESPAWLGIELEVDANTRKGPRISGDCPAHRLAARITSSLCMTRLNDKEFYECDCFPGTSDRKNIMHGFEDKSPLKHAIITNAPSVGEAPGCRTTFDASGRELHRAAPRQVTRL